MNKKFLKSIYTILWLIFFNYNTSIAAKNIPSSFADLAEKLMPSVVNISTTQIIKTNSNPNFPFRFPPGSPFEDFFKEYNQQPQERQVTALGSGFIINSEGLVITNNHVIRDADDIVVRVNGNKTYKAKVIGADPYSDVAVLKIESSEKFQTVKFGNSDKARVGDWVIAIGNPFGLGGTVTSGIISARNRDINLTRYDDFIQTDASINQGNSGGPLFNMKGEVIGINTAILGQTGSIGIGFAIPANSAKKVINQLIEFGETKRGWLGVRIQDVTEEIAEVEKLETPKGALIASVAPGSPADKAGVKEGDIILEFDGQEVDKMRTLPKLVANTEVGKKVKVKIWRNQKIILKRIVLGRLESSEDFVEERKAEKEKIIETTIEDLKISVTNLNLNQIDKRKLPKKTTGVIITDIDKSSPLFGFIEVNSVIVEIQKKKIKNANDLIQKVKDSILKNKKTLLFTIYTNENQRRYIGIKIK